MALRSLPNLVGAASELRASASDLIGEISDLEASASEPRASVPHLMDAMSDRKAPMPHPKAPMPHPKGPVSHPKGPVSHAKGPVSALVDPTSLCRTGKFAPCRLVDHELDLSAARLGEFARLPGLQVVYIRYLGVRQAIEISGAVIVTFVGGVVGEGGAIVQHVVAD